MVTLYARVWIEIRPAGWKSYPGSVALYARAWIEILLSPGDVWGANVALHAEGVDRNTHYDALIADGAMSPSMRRAWIEI